jgi:hypothetical protein
LTHTLQKYSIADECPLFTCARRQSEVNTQWQMTEPAGSSPCRASPFVAKAVSWLQEIVLQYWPEPAQSTSHSLHHSPAECRQQSTCWYE